MVSRDGRGVVSLLVGLLFVVSAEVAGAWPDAGPFRRFLALADMGVNADDVQLGVYGGVFFPTTPSVGVTCLLSSRVGRKTEQQQLGPHLYLQHREWRGFGALGVESSLAITRRVALCAMAGAGYSAADYSGTGAAPEEGWSPLVRAGVSLSTPLGSALGVLRVGYQHGDLRSVAANWGTLAVGAAW
jgi:hypothetical protein